MTSPYPPYQQPRKLERSRTNRVLGGVCGGVANYVNMDPTLVRVLTVVISLFTGVPVILYLIALFVIPEESTNSDQQNYPPVNGPQWNYGPYGQGAQGFEDPATGQPSYAPGPGQQPAPGYGTVNPEDRAVWGAEGAPWEAGTQTPPASQPQPQPGADSEQTSTWESTPADPDVDPNADRGDGDQRR